MDSCIFIKKIWNIYNLTGGVEMDNPKSLLNDENVCFLMGDDLENGCFNEADSACRVRMPIVQTFRGEKSH